ncbi:hypothetical protein AO825_11680 [Pectobacterium brasiliense]|uniref:EpsG family protein n=1 Tax=Pectobacterium brasiliense TaxID=180957 RepID=UPI0001A43033|nr:EpsG family protein [Pectobacterium brasiliense]KGA24614.1 hypothetical protein KS44_04670 [Pectobacterium brasiliense]KRF61590.1 hypothetical protein AO825_11680 [Pectobacterium brasiliense]MBN3185753.1 EpsG family protein [Pectobacterium brasiliense]QHG26603.1 oligosaccharide repeat unit polymerase [Pectobacterium brasiliense]
MWMLIFFTLLYFAYSCLIVFSIKNKHLSIGLLLLPVTILSGFRYDVGFDFNTYVLYFHQSQNDNEVYLDATFRLLSKICGDIGANEQLLFLTYSLLSSYMIYKIVIKIAYSYNVVEINTFVLLIILSFYSFYFFLSQNQIRSSLSALFLCYAFLRKEKDIWCYINLILGVLFHSAAIFLVPLIFIIDRVSIKLIFIIFPIIAAFAFFNFFTDFIKLFLSAFNSRFLVYFNSDFFEPKAGLEKIYTLITTVIMFAMLNAAVRILDSSFERTLKFCYLFLLLRLMSIDALIFARLSDFLKPLSIVIVSVTICYISKKIKPNILAFLYLIAVMFAAILNIFWGSNISDLNDYKYNFNICLFGEICPV